MTSSPPSSIASASPSGPSSAMIAPGHPAPPRPALSRPASSRPAPSRAGSWALALALLALVGGVGAMAAVGVSVVPMEAASGYYFSDTPGWYQGAVLAGFGSLLLWTLAGLAAIVLAVLSLREGRGRGRATAALVIALLAPVLTTVTLLGGMLLGTDLL